MGLGETSCVSCGQCIAVCPTGALTEKDYTDEVLAAIADPSKHVVVQTAPAVRAALGEEFGYPIGTDVEGKMAAALRRLGFDKVFDTNFSADLTIMEEATEFLDRVKNGGVLPLITSCSPGWIKYCEHYFPEMTENLSSCKSPQQMFGAITKTYYAEKMGLDPKDIVCVSVMPCTAKKFEIGRDDQSAAGVPDVDIAITTRELARLIKRVGLDFVNLPEEGFDDPLGESTGAAVIFGATGGVMEAALRTAVETLTGEELASLDFTDVRGTQGIKEASYNVAGLEVKVAVASGLNNAKELLNKVKSGEANYHFIEIMGCPGGCVNGGGQPQVPADVRNFVDVKALRAKALYDNDAAQAVRKSHENPAVKKLYEEFLGHPGSHKAHNILHTTYVKRTIN
jgi:NADP-reducing hydrogenase subunit HndD